MSNVDNASSQEESLESESIPIEEIARSELKDEEGNLISLGDYMLRRAEKSMRGGFGYFDDGSPFVYPRLDLTDDEHERFLAGLKDAVTSVRNKYGLDAKLSADAQSTDRDP